MKVCIIGGGLVGLALAKVLALKEISVDILSDRNINKYKIDRTIGISNSNIKYFNENIENIEKILWDVNNIKVYTENFLNNEILNFENTNENIFSIVKNYELKKLLVNKLRKSKFVKFKSNMSYSDIIKQQYKLIINCDVNHQVTKKFFSNKIEKDYDSYAYTTTIYHKKITNNNTAFQNFTNNGPIAFLPISETQTSVVYSFRSIEKKSSRDIKKLIKKYNPFYSIIKINDCSLFKLKSSYSRKYYNENFLAFGDLLHKIHPLAGQGFNMSLRDIKLLSDLIEEKINLGLDLDYSICYKFQKNSRDRNYLFSSGIDWIYELFNYDSRLNTNLLTKSISIFGKNKIVNSFFKKFADDGLRF